MLPWTAEFVAQEAGEAYDGDRIMREARDNARIVYGV